MSLWQFLGLAMAAAMLCMVVRAQQPQLAGLCALAAGVMLLIGALEQVALISAWIMRLGELGGLEPSYLPALMKVLGVSYMAELTAQACTDMGENGLALKVSLVGKLCVFALTAPMLLGLLEMILELAP